MMIIYHGWSGLIMIDWGLPKWEEGKKIGIYLLQTNQMVVQVK